MSYAPRPDERQRVAPRTLPKIPIPTLSGEENLSANWLIYHGEGYTLRDFENGHDGDLSPTYPKWESRRGMWTLLYNAGTGYYVEVPDHADFRPTDFSCMAWFRCPSATAWHTIFGKEYWNNNTGWIVMVDNDGTVTVRGPEFAEITTTGTYDDGDWHLAVVTFDGATDEWTIDVDGGSETVTVGGAFTHSTLSLLLGARHNNDGTLSDSVYDGNLALLKFFTDRILSSAFISEYYERTRPIFRS